MAQGAWAQGAWRRGRGIGRGIGRGRRAWSKQVGWGATSTLGALHGVVSHGAVSLMEAARRVRGGDHGTGREARRGAKVLSLDHAAERDKRVLGEDVTCMHTHTRRLGTLPGCSLDTYGCSLGCTWLQCLGRAEELADGLQVAAYEAGT